MHTHTDDSTTDLELDVAEHQIEVRGHFDLVDCLLIFWVERAIHLCADTNGLRVTLARVFRIVLLRKFKNTRNCLSNVRLCCLPHNISP